MSPKMETSTIKILNGRATACTPLRVTSQIELLRVSMGHVSVNVYSLTLVQIRISICERKKAEHLLA